jgi:hypothetical protein
VAQGKKKSVSVARTTPRYRKGGKGSVQTARGRSQVREAKLDTRERSVQHAKPPGTKRADTKLTKKAPSGKAKKASPGRRSRRG